MKVQIAEKFNEGERVINPAHVMEVMPAMLRAKDGQSKRPASRLVMRTGHGLLVDTPYEEMSAALEAAWAESGNGAGRAEGGGGLSEKDVATAIDKALKNVVAEAVKAAEKAGAEAGAKAAQSVPKAEKGGKG